MKSSYEDGLVESRCATECDDYEYVLESEQIGDCCHFTLKIKLPCEILIALSDTVYKPDFILPDAIIHNDKYVYYFTKCDCNPPLEVYFYQYGNPTFCFAVPLECDCCIRVDMEVTGIENFDGCCKYNVSVENYTGCSLQIKDNASNTISD